MKRGNGVKEKKIDNRIRRTKRLLREGITQLLSVKSINKISVRELTDLVEINRGTFYLHYKDIYDLVDQLENELCSEFEDMINQKKISSMDDSLHLFESICNFFENNKALCNVLLSDNGDINFILKIKAILSRKCFNDFPKNYMDAAKHLYTPYVASYFESGLIGVLRYWLADTSDDRMVPNEMAAVMKALFADGLNGLSEIKKK